MERRFKNFDEELYVYLRTRDREREGNSANSVSEIRVTGETNNYEIVKNLTNVT